MIKLTPSEWKLFLAAYMYEVHDLSVMSDSSYDYLSNTIAMEGNTNIPGFDSNTGMWAINLFNSFSKEEQDLVCKYAMWWYALGEGTYIGHVLPDDWLLNYNKGYYDYKLKIQSSKPFK